MLLFAKFVNDQILDAALDNLINNAEEFILCEGQPATYADATTLKSSAGNKLGSVTIGAGDFTKADGDVSGRKVTVAAQTDVLVDESGTLDHVAIVDNTGTTLLLVTTTASVSVTASGTVNTDAFDEEIEDPA